MFAGQAAEMDTHYDPAPEPKAGSTEVQHAKAWINGSLKGVNSNGDQSENDGVEAWDESLFITWHSCSKSGSSSSETKPHMHVPSSFSSRESFQVLLKMELADLPGVPGYTLSHHCSSQQWHARNPEGSNYAPTWGKARTELQALVLAMLKVWTWFRDSLTNDSEIEQAQSCIDKLQAFGDSIAGDVI